MKKKNNIITDTLPKHKEILVDSNVINHALSRETSLKTATSSLIEILLSDEYSNNLYISVFTYYELLKGATESKRAEVENYIEKFKLIPWDTTRINRTAHLFTKYKNHKQIKNIIDSISTADIVNGSLIFTEIQPMLLTCDYNDYPRPFFTEKYLYKIEYTKGRGNKSCQYCYFLEANLDEFNS